MHIRIVVEAEVKHVSGKFISRDDMIEHIKDNIGEPDVSVDDSEYELGDWSVDELPEGHCDPAIRRSVEALLKTLAKDKTFKDYNQRTARLRKHFGIRQS